MGPIGCPETSVTNYQSTLRNILEKRRYILLWFVLNVGGSFIGGDANNA
jgi:hypothetical protein